MRTLSLPPRRRGGEPETTVAQIAAGQPHVPVLVDYNLGSREAWPPEQRVIVTIRRAANDSTVWTTEGSALSLWDPATESTSILVPTRVLTAGDYRFELSVPDSAAPIYSSPFRVAP